MNELLNIHETPLLSRRKFLQKFGLTLLSLPVLTTSYSFFFERFWLEKHTIRMSFPRLPLAFSGFKIVQVSDIHFGYFYTIDHLQKLVMQVNSLRPDVILFTGDLIDESVHELDQCVPVLKRLSAPLGKLAVLGNHDYRIGKQDQVMEAWGKSGFQLLKNQNWPIEKMGSRIWFAGVDDLFAQPDLKAATAGIPSDQFTILLAHEPDFALFPTDHPIDLQLSGHSHGGQIRIPYYGALYKPDGAKTYYEGLNQVADTQTILYVNRGIGTTYLPFRFRCRPEITQFIIRSSPNSKSPAVM